MSSAVKAKHANHLEIYEAAGLSSAAAEELLGRTVKAVTEAGQALLQTYNRSTRQNDLQQLLASIKQQEGVSAPILRSHLETALPNTHWDEDEFDGGDLPEGLWWITDAVEGNINLIQGMPEWCTTATLVVDGQALLTAVHDPLKQTTYAARLGAGAFENGRRMHASAKTDLKAALIGTGQAKPNEDVATQHRMIDSIGAMLQAGLVLHVSVPATLQLVEVAAGRRDVFWQASQVRSGLMAGGLLVAEAGGVTSDFKGRPWRLDSKDFLASARDLHAAAVDVLTTLD